MEVAVDQQTHNSANSSAFISDKLLPPKPCRTNIAAIMLTSILGIDDFSLEQACDLQASCKCEIVNSVGKETSEC